MPQLRLIPLLLHGALDYLLGVLLVVSPFLFDLEASDTPTVASLVAGVIVLALALVSDLPTAALRAVPQSVHEGVDYLVALGAVLFPFLLGLSDNEALVGWYVGIGVVWFALTLVTSFSRKIAEAAGDHAGDQHTDGQS